VQGERTKYRCWTPPNPGLLWYIQGFEPFDNWLADKVIQARKYGAQMTLILLGIKTLLLGVSAILQPIPKFHCTAVKVPSGSDEGRRGVVEKDEDVGTPNGMINDDYWPT